MIEMILEKFTEITSKCLEREAKNLKAEYQDMALVFKFDNDSEVQYLILKNFNTIKNISFLEVLGVRIDFKGYSLFVPKFIKGALNRFCDEEKISADKVSVITYFDDKKEMNMFLYNGGVCIKRITLESLFDTNDIIE